LLNFLLNLRELSSCESTSSESSFKTKQIRNKIKRDININLKELDGGEDLPENGLYKVIGQVDEQPVFEKKPRHYFLNFLIWFIHGPAPILVDLC